MYNLDATDALKNLQLQIARLERFEQTMPDRLREVAQQGADFVQFRVQFQGENAEGVKMQSGSRERRGAYSREWGAERERAGLQTGIIDLTYSGRLFDSWGASGSGNESGAGFNDSAIDERAGWLEEYFGPIFQLNEYEANDLAAFMHQLNQQALSY